MRFGLFGGAHASRSADGDPAAGFRDFIDTSVEAESLGFHSTFLVEHHFSGSGQVSSPLDLLSWVAARTTTIRLGTAVMVLPWHNPVLLAERAATLDLLSAGRLDFGVGKGYRHPEFAGFHVPPETAEARFDESLSVILQAWQSDVRFSHRGQYWRYDDILVEPPPAQKPHPPIWIAARTPESVRKVAARGANLLIDQFCSVEMVGNQLRLFKAECEANNRTFDPMDVAVARNIYVARDPSDAHEALLHQTEIHTRMIRGSRGTGEAGGSHILAYADQPGATEAGALIGSASELIEALQALGAVGVSYILLAGQTTTQNIRRFATEVMPALQ